MKVTFLPSPAVPGLLAGLAFAAVALAPVPGGGWAALAVGLAVVLATVVEGLKHPGPAVVSVEREVPRPLSVGGEARITLRLRNRSAVPMTLVLADGCPAELEPEAELLQTELPPHESVVLQYSVRPRQRGSFAFGPMQLRLGRPRSLARWQMELPLAGEARVHPDLRDLARYQLRARRELLVAAGARRTRIAGREGDFERLRDFVAGDDLRHVDWKATARLRKPITRVYQAQRAQNLVVLVDATRLMGARAGGSSKLDHAISAALMLTYVALERGDRVGVGVFDDRIRSWVPPQGGTTQFGRVLDALVEQQPAMRFPRYREAARGLAQHVRRRSLVVWLTDLFDGEQGKELLLGLRALRRRHLSLVVAMDDPGVHDLAGQDPVDQPALFERAAAIELLAARESLIRSLTVEGASVVDKQPGDISAALVDRYLDIKARGQL